MFSRKVYILLMKLMVAILIHWVNYISLKVNHMAPNIYQRIVDLLHRAENSPKIGREKLNSAYQDFLRESSDASINEPSGASFSTTEIQPLPSLPLYSSDPYRRRNNPISKATASSDIWSSLIAQAMAQPAQHRSRCFTNPWSYYPAY